MTQFYTDPSREHDPRALPNAEVWYEGKRSTVGTGWYWWACLPGCLPDSDPSGPFDTKAEAMADARDYD